MKKEKNEIKKSKPATLHKNRTFQCSSEYEITM